MSSDEVEKFLIIKKILNKYLRDNALPKLAYLTNCLPTPLERSYLLEDFSYICFCANDYYDLSKVLFLLHLYKYKKIPFDVTIEDPIRRLFKKRFGYICLECKSSSQANDFLREIVKNKNDIYKKYPAILRLFCNSESLMMNPLPKNAVLIKKIKKNELILRMAI